ncbi:MAG: hypothetical protein ABR956_02125 [Terracidiphilus sp.]
MKVRSCKNLSIGGLLLAALLFSGRLNAQNLTLEGYTGGFITPTAYVVESEKGQLFSHPAVGYHFIGANAVIGDIHTFGIAEGIGNRAEVAYGRNVHLTGDSAAFSGLWHANGMNIFSGKIVAIKDGEFHKYMPGVAVGGITRTGDKFVSGTAPIAAAQSYDYLCEVTEMCAPVPIPAAKAYSNGDVYIVATKTWAKPPVPFLATFGWKMTNASILGIGGQATRFGGRLFGGIGFPLPGPWKTVIVPSAGFMQEPKQIQNLSALLVAPPTYTPPAPVHIPTTLDYAIRVTQREHPHFTFDIGVGQVAGTIGTTLTPTFDPEQPFAPIPVSLQARHVVATGLSYRY